MPKNKNAQQNRNLYACESCGQIVRAPKDDESFVSDCVCDPMVTYERLDESEIPAELEHLPGGEDSRNSPCPECGGLSGHARECSKAEQCSQERDQ